MLLDVLVSSYLKLPPWYVYETSKERTSELGIVGFSGLILWYYY